MTRPESSPCAICGMRQPMLHSYPVQQGGAFLPNSLALCDEHFEQAQRGELDQPRARRLEVNLGRGTVHVE